MTIRVGDVIRRARQRQGLTLAWLSERTGCSVGQLSRYERGLTPLTDIDVLRGFATVLGLNPVELGLAPAAPAPASAESAGGRSGAVGPWPRRTSSDPRPAEREGDDPVRRRRLLGGLAVTAAAAAGIPLPSGSPRPDTDAAAGDALVAGLRDAMLGIGARPPGTELPDALLERALAAFHACDYTALAFLPPAAIRTGHADGTDTGLARAYVLATRMLVKLDEQQLGWMAADRARQYAGSTGDPMQSAEAARQLAVLARRAGWHDQALSIALAAAGDPALRAAGPDGAAQRGLLVQSAAYTAARADDADGMRELTSEAVAIAAALRGTTRLRHHGGGFSSATVQLHLVSAENSAGDPSRALTAAKALIPRELPTVERQARYYSDVATAYAAWGRRDDCVRALLAAERMAPQETHTRPAVRAMVQGLLVSGRTTTELRGLAARSGLTF